MEIKPKYSSSNATISWKTMKKKYDLLNLNN